MSLPQPSFKDSSWLRRLMPRSADWVLTVIYLGVLGVYYFFAYRGVCVKCEPTIFTSFLIALATLAVLVLDRVEYWRYGDCPPFWNAALHMVARTLLIVLIATIDGYKFSMFLFLFIPFTAFPIFGRTISYGLAAACWLIYIVKQPDWMSNEHEASFFFVYTFGMIFIVTMANVISQERMARAKTEKLLYELEDSHQQLREKTNRVAELAATEERNRLARDIHDSLGHYLTVINIQLEKAMAFRRLSPDEADKSVKNAKHLSSEALKDIRQSVTALRDGDISFSLTDALAELVEHVQTEELSVSLEVKGKEEGYSRQTLVTLYRAVQEGLTNIQKHAQATHAKVQVALLPNHANLLIEDNGQGFDPALLKAQNSNGEEGFGLISVRERIELLSGTLHLESQPAQGTRIAISAPREPASLATAS